MEYEFKDLTLTKKEEEEMRNRLDELFRSFARGLFFFVTVPHNIYKKIHTKVVTHS